jgi:hypothetical protein
MRLIKLQTIGTWIDPDEVVAVDARAGTSIIVHLKGGGTIFPTVPGGSNADAVCDSLAQQVNANRSWMAAEPNKT